MTVSGLTIWIAFKIPREDSEQPHKQQSIGVRQSRTFRISASKDVELVAEDQLLGLERGLKVDGRVLCVIDGGRSIRKALADVFCDLVVVHRCRVHKKRNVLDHLPQCRKARVARALSEAWASDSAELARRRLKALLQWLERNGESGAAASLREGMEETLTVLKLELPAALRDFLVTTNAIENE